MKKEMFNKIDADECVINDNAGLPSVMVPILKMKSSELNPYLPNHTHPAFIVDGKEIDTVYISKYINVIIDGRAYSLPNQKPETMVSFDEAIEACRKKGHGWGLMPASLWAFIALWCKNNNCIPYGNTKFGHSFDNECLKGISAEEHASNRTYLTKTGSGPVLWNHNHKANGICDLVGNVFEWQAGLRSIEAGIQVIPDANVMMESISQAYDSTAWKYIGVDGNYTNNKSEALKLDFDDSKNAYVYKSSEKLNSIMNTARYCEFRNIKNTVNIPHIMKELILFPADNPESYKKDLFYMANQLPEGIAFRGGYFNGDFMSGMFNTGINMIRNDKTPYIGFRSVYYDL